MKKNLPASKSCHNCTDKGYTKENGQLVCRNGFNFDFKRNSYSPEYAAKCKDYKILHYTDIDPVPYTPNGTGQAGQGGVLEATDGRKPCPLESWCPVEPGCHVCGSTSEELESEKNGGPVYERRK